MRHEFNTTRFHTGFFRLRPSSPAVYRMKKRLLDFSNKCLSRFGLYLSPKTLEAMKECVYQSLFCTLFEIAVQDDPDERKRLADNLVVNHRPEPEGMYVELLDKIKNAGFGLKIAVVDDGGKPVMKGKLFFQTEFPTPDSVSEFCRDYYSNDGNDDGNDDVAEEEPNVVIAHIYSKNARTSIIIN